MAATLGQPLPAWELPTFFGPPQRHRLSDYAGQVGVMLFWAANPLCKRYQPYLDGFAAAYKPRGVALLAIDSDPFDSPERARLVVGAAPHHFPVLRDADGSIARAYGVEVVPTFYVADQKGILRYWGAMDDRSFDKLWPDTNYLEEAVERLLLGEEVADPHNPPVGHELRFASRAGRR